MHCPQQNTESIALHGSCEGLHVPLATSKNEACSTPSSPKILLLYALVSLFLNDCQEEKVLTLTVGVGVLCSAVFNGSVPLCQWAVHWEKQEVRSQPGLQ